MVRETVLPIPESVGVLEQRLVDAGFHGEILETILEEVQNSNSLTDIGASKHLEKLLTDVRAIS